MKPKYLALLFSTVMTQALWAQQFTPPALPPGVKGNSEMAEGEIVKVYALDDRGAKFRAYAVKYKGSEVILTDTMAQTNKQVGDKVSFLAIRVEAPVGDKKITTLSFSILNIPVAKAKK